MMKRFEELDFSKTYGDMPESFSRRVQSTLRQMEREKAPRTIRRTAVLAVVLALLLLTAAAAAVLSPTANIFGWFYGPETANKLLEGDVAAAGQSYRLGEVIYTLEDVIWSKGSLYGTGVIRPAEGAKAVLLPEDYNVNEPMGYTLHYGEDIVIPDDAPSYAETAEKTGAKIYLVRCTAEGLVEPDGTLNASEVGYSSIPQPDDTIRFAFEFAGGAQQDDDRGCSLLERSDRYTVRLSLSCWEVTLEGDWLREEDNDTSLRKEWDVTVTPEMKEE